MNGNIYVITYIQILAELPGVAQDKEATTTRAYDSLQIVIQI